MKIAIIKTEQEIFSEKKNRNINKRLKILAIFLFLLFLILFIIISKFHQKTKIIFRSKKENEIYKNIAKKQKVELKLLELKIQQLKNQLIINEVEFNHTIKYYLDTIKKYNHSLYNKIELNIKFKNDLLMKINRTYTKNGVVNINLI
jgi:preprotein translocase subunit SecG